MVMRPFVRRHLPFLLQSRPPYVRHTSLHSVDIEQPMTGVNIPVEFRSKTIADFGGINSSAGWVWDRGGRFDTLTSLRTTRADVERGNDEGWPLRNDISPRIDRVSEGACNPGKALVWAETTCDSEYFARGIQEMDAYFENYGVIDTHARTASYVAAGGSWKVQEPGKA